MVSTLSSPAVVGFIDQLQISNYPNSSQFWVYIIPISIGDWTSAASCSMSSKHFVLTCMTTRPGPKNSKMLVKAFHTSVIWSYNCICSIVSLFTVDVCKIWVIVNYIFFFIKSSNTLYSTNLMPCKILVHCEFGLW